MIYTEKSYTASHSEIKELLTHKEYRKSCFNKIDKIANKIINAGLQAERIIIRFYYKK